jgi:hypothetical protein
MGTTGLKPALLYLAWEHIAWKDTPHVDAFFVFHFVYVHVV